jgi:hypothetical protein
MAEDFLEGLEVEFRGVGLGKTHDTECCGDVWARANGSVLETAEEAGLDITGKTHEGDGGGLANRGKETEVHGQGGR